ncbi:SLC13 family permease [Proteiniborus sp. MB09-C3]|uniref:SLC13 family permease n=1 Tax=Proteiniborus sp. MB09-C3 TaxID=3050072 RepID=UPI0025562FB2|nr:SLC13 family permease [Proteiniborus sp. MB09-C3]WIV10426.1 SLC13 family permease [Proteiniborus sp. MB09-C3]
MYKKWFLIIIFPILILLLRPLGIDLNQSIILSTLIFVIILWVTGIVSKTYASIFLLIIFSIFGKTPIDKIFQFPLSESFLMFVLSFIFSQGIANSKIAEKIIEPIFKRFGTNYISLIITIVITQLVMIFVIPQPFSRIIIIAMIFKSFLNKIKVDNSLEEVLLFGVFAFSVIVNLMFKRGDIIISTALTTIGNIQISEIQWIQYMTVPTTILCLLCIILYIFIFKKELVTYNQIKKDSFEVNRKFDKKEKINGLLILVIILFWATEALHNINEIYIVSAGIIIMFALKILTIKDYKAVNLELLVFLTAAFSIGQVMKFSGIADLLFSKFIVLFPDDFNLIYMLIVVLISLILHMIIGSNVATMSVVIPGILAISAGGINNIPLLFIILITVCTHYILPFHNVILLVGNGNNYYSSKTVSRFGVVYTVILFISICTLYYVWWNIVGLI